MEFINDAYWLEYLYKFYNTTTNRKLKDILEIFLLDKYLLFFAETMKDNKAGIGPCSSLTKN